MSHPFLAALLLLAPLSTRQDVGATPPRSALAQARELAPGEVRAKALVRALGETSAAGLDECLALAFEEFLNQTRAFRMDLALPLAEGMHARAQADWSAMSLGLACTRAGLNARAADVLREQLTLSEEGPDQAALMERLGLAYLGARQEAPARRELGAALARGSSNAGVVLGMLALRQGRPVAARALFRSILDEEPAQSWAHRGWGLSMLPRPDEAEAPR